MRNKVVAVLCSDIHLSLRPPSARAGEPDWLEAQRGILHQLENLAFGRCPILCAGDVFDRWNSPVELVNWVIRHAPMLYAIPGQHDLPYHSLDLIHRSAYWTLAHANRLYHIQDGPQGIGEVLVQGFPWGVPLTPAPKKERGQKITVALIHQYVWIQGHHYPGAPEESQVHNLFKDGMGWDVIVCGDNHKGFITKTKAGTTIFNCGALQRRRADEADYRPQVGLLYTDGIVEPHYLDTSQDILTAPPKTTAEEGLDLEDFLALIGDLQGQTLDFKSAINHAMNDKGTEPAVRQILLEAME